ncbi:MAG: TetR/AcrR family transcriptional regulator [Betaproteobacteria bacterium]|jgi:AcrR family transcriptional regulator|nr:TetR/AcrR family transcriptional regulator [Betaproteobacteria bacterium]NBT67503.1 TetR/AcrR family transcriptional regulator [Betaproteobacteria bacterium]NBY08531.1 TetR/AcrR family transcriptional regulator [Betaproteobacteria bacterium]
MVKKAPRRTAERILEVTLTLFNRYGEPNVSTTLISSELNISPGNLYYHFPAKDELVNALFDRYEVELHRLLSAATEVADIENAWFFMHSLFELVWQYRFLYRDLNDLLTKNRRLETHVKDALLHKTSAFKSLLQGLESSTALKMDADEREACATHMVVILTWWLSFEYVKDPRHALEDASAVRAVMRGAQGVLGLLLPYLESPHKDHLRGLLSAYKS